MIEIVAIGDELLCGRTLDTNSSVISQALQGCGYAVDRVTLVGDVEEHIRVALVSAMQRCAVVITTGGLGPTLDDHTMPICADLFDCPMEFSAAIAEDLQNRYGDIASLEHQATVPKGAQLIPNRQGTASGAIFKREGRFLIVLPGVPNEMQAMLQEHVLPFIQEHMQAVRQFVRYFHLTHRIENDIDPFLRTVDSNVSCGIYPSLGMLSVSMKAAHEEVLVKEASRFEETFQKVIFSKEDTRIEKAVHDLFCDSKRTLSLAESCTGGMIAARLCQIPQASRYFLGGIVSYCDAIKEKILFVKKEALESSGAVSRAVVEQMARGAIEQTGSNYSIAVSGVSGPDGGTREKPIGTVWTAIASRDEIFSGLLPIKGGKSRRAIIEYTGTYTLGLLWRWLKYGVFPSEEFK